MKQNKTQPAGRVTLEQHVMKTSYINLYSNHWTAHDTAAIARMVAQSGCLYVAVPACFENKEQQTKCDHKFIQSVIAGDPAHCRKCGLERLTDEDA